MAADRELEMMMVGWLAGTAADGWSHGLAAGTETTLCSLVCCETFLYPELVLQPHWLSSFFQLFLKNVGVPTGYNTFYSLFIMS